MSTLSPLLPLPERRRQYRFILTPLADAMFQLLIFFMLSSSIAPYALLTIRSGGDAATEPALGTGDTGAVSNGPAAIWNISESGVIIRGQTFGFADLTALSEAVAREDASLLLVVRDTASVQNLTDVLEELTLAGVPDVQIAGVPAE